MTNRQIVLTSDRPVTALTLLEDRIQSRLAGGLVVDIQPPDIETRIAILRAKADGTRQPVSDDVLHYLAERIHKNIRELEGSLNKVIAFADLMGTPVTVDLVKRAIADVVETAAERQIPETVVIETVAAHFGVSVETLKGRKRDKKTSLARQVAMYLLREESQLGQSAIGYALGGKAHNTVMHGCERIANQLSVDPHLRPRHHQHQRSPSRLLTPQVWRAGTHVVGKCKTPNSTRHSRARGNPRSGSPLGNPQAGNHHSPCSTPTFAGVTRLLLMEFCTPLHTGAGLVAELYGCRARSARTAVLRPHLTLFPT